MFLRALTILPFLFGSAAGFADGLTMVAPRTVVALRPVSSACRQQVARFNFNQTTVDAPRREKAPRAFVVAPGPDRISLTDSFKGQLSIDRQSVRFVDWVGEQDGHHVFRAEDQNREIWAIYAREHFSDSGVRTAWTWVRVPWIDYQRKKYEPEAQKLRLTLQKDGLKVRDVEFAAMGGENIVFYAIDTDNNQWAILVPKAPSPNTFLRLVHQGELRDRMIDQEVPNGHYNAGRVRAKIGGEGDARYLKMPWLPHTIIESLRDALTDFGMASVRGPDGVWRVHGLTDAEANSLARGTPLYMSDDMIRGNKNSVRVDLDPLSTIFAETALGRAVSDESDGLSELHTRVRVLGAMYSTSFGKSVDSVNANRKGDKVEPILATIAHLRPASAAEARYVIGKGKLAYTERESDLRKLLLEQGIRVDPRDSGEEVRLIWFLNEFKKDVLEHRLDDPLGLKEVAGMIFSSPTLTQHFDQMWGQDQATARKILDMARELDSSREMVRRYILDSKAIDAVAKRYRNAA
ncbi:MAG: hypothetical protein HYR96_05780 [Deltaproteobacteria bacterium]|nr:hypothetical protein [Deltaproteobacteria bacterium]